MAPPNNYKRPGITVTTDSTRPVDVSGSQVEITNLAEIATDANPLPVSVDMEILEAIEAMRMAMNQVATILSRFVPDSTGRNRVAIESGGVTISSGTVTTVTTVGTVSNQTSIGGVNAAPVVNALTQSAASSLRRNITTS